MRIWVRLSLIFASIGSAFLLAGACLAASEIRFKSNAIDLKGIVSDFRRNGYTYEYPEGIRHFAIPHASNSEWNWMNGDTIDIRVDAAKPGRSQVSGFVDQWFAASISIFFGAVIGGIGFGMIRHRKRKESLRKILLDRGTKIQARISSIGIDHSTSLNGRSPFIIRSEAMIDGKIRLFESESIWFDPVPYLKTGCVDVYYDPEKAGSYYVDIPGLPEISE